MADTLDICFLGTAGYFPSPTRHTCSVLIPRHGILLDAGSGIHRLTQHPLPTHLQVFLSHAHLDHICGLPALLGLASRCGLSRITVNAIEPVLCAVREHLFANPLFPAETPFEWRELELYTDYDVPGGGRIRGFPLEHPGGSTGFRIDWPEKSLAYVTDTTAMVDAPYVAELTDVNLLLHECNFNAAHAEWAKQTGHSWTSQVGQVAARANAGKLVVFHVDPLSEEDPPLRLDEIREHFPRVELAEDAMVVSL